MKESDFKNVVNDHYDRWKFTKDGRFPKAKLQKEWKRKRRKHQRSIEKRHDEKIFRSEEY